MRKKLEVYLINSQVISHMFCYFFLCLFKSTKGDSIKSVIPPTNNLKNFPQLIIPRKQQKNIKKNHPVTPFTKAPHDDYQFYAKKKNKNSFDRQLKGVKININLYANEDNTNRIWFLSIVLSKQSLATVKKPNEFFLQ